MKQKFINITKQYFAILIVILLLAFIIMNITTTLLFKITESSINEINKLTTKLVTNEIEKMEKLLDKLAELDFIQNPNTPILEKLELLTKFREENDLSDIGIVDLEGWIYTYGQTNGIFVGERDYYLSALKGKTTLTGPFISLVDGQLIVVLSKPIYFENKMVNVLVSIYRLDFLSRIVENISFLETGKVFIVDEYGMFIASKDPSMIGKSVSETFDMSSLKTDKAIEDIVSQMAKENKWFTEIELQGVDYFIGFQEIPETQWSLVFSVEKMDIMGIKNKIVKVFHIIIVILGIGTMIVNIYFNILKRRAKRNFDISQNAIKAANIMVITTNLDFNILSLNHYALDNLGYDKAFFTDKSMQRIMDEKSWIEFLKKIDELSLSSAHQKFDTELTRADGRILYVEFYVNYDQKHKGKIEFMGIDITERILYQKEILKQHEELTIFNEELIASEEEIEQKCFELEETTKLLEHIAYHDMLTGLPNRLNLNKKIDEMINNTSLNNKKFGVLFLDIDNFKNINDRFGHFTGDDLLVKTSNRLSSEIYNDQTTIFRISGDEFIILVEEINDVIECENLALKAIELLKGPFEIEKEIVSITVSVGITIYPDDGYTVEDILKKSDLAMYKAKEEGRNRYKVYNSSQLEEITSKILIEENLKKALAENEFELYYQPIINLQSDKLSGFEALIRWNNAEEGFISPLNFIPIAEKTGLIVPIGKWVLESACKFMKSLVDKDYTDIYVSINVSVIQINQNDFVEMVEEVLKTTGLPGHYVVLEITESVTLEYYDCNLEKMKKLNKLGVRFALDDFGEGYSSFSYLRNLPLKALKIDGSFVNYIVNGKDGGLLEAIINVGHQLGLVVIAEGVETFDQSEYLKSLGCDRVQGYYYSKPLSEKLFMKFLKNINFNIN